MRWWAEWRQLRLLPYDGELADQPAWVVDVIQLAEQAFAAEQARQQKARAAEIERQQKGGR